MSKGVGDETDKEHPPAMKDPREHHNDRTESGHLRVTFNEEKMNSVIPNIEGRMIPSSGDHPVHDPSPDEQPTATQESEAVAAILAKYEDNDENEGKDDDEDSFVAPILIHQKDDDDDDERKKHHVSFNEEKMECIIPNIEGTMIPSSGDHPTHRKLPNSAPSDATSASTDADEAVAAVLAKYEDDSKEEDEKEEDFVAPILVRQRDDDDGPKHNVSFNEAKMESIIPNIEGTVIPSSHRKPENPPTATPDEAVAAVLAKYGEDVNDADNQEDETPINPILIHHDNGDGDDEDRPRHNVKFNEEKIEKIIPNIEGAVIPSTHRKNADVLSKSPDEAVAAVLAQYGDEANPAEDDEEEETRINPILIRRDSGDDTDNDENRPKNNVKFNEKKIEQVIPNIEGAVIPSSGKHPTSRKIPNQTSASDEAVAAVLAKYEGETKEGDDDEEIEPPLNPILVKHDSKDGESGDEGPKHNVKFNEEKIEQVIPNIEGTVIPSSGNHPTHPKPPVASIPEDDAVAAALAEYNMDEDEDEDKPRLVSPILIHHDGNDEKRPHHHVKFNEQKIEQVIPNIEGTIIPSSGTHPFHPKPPVEAQLADSNQEGGDDDVEQINPILIHRDSSTSSDGGTDEQYRMRKKRRVSFNEEKIEQVIPNIEGAVIASMPQNHPKLHPKLPPPTFGSSRGIFSPGSPGAKFYDNIRSTSLVSALSFMGIGILLALVAQDWDYLYYSAKTIDVDGPLRQQLGFEIVPPGADLDQEKKLYPWKFQTIDQLLYNSAEASEHDLALLVARIDYLVEGEDMTRRAVSECMQAGNQCRALANLPTSFVEELQKGPTPSATDLAIATQQKRRKPGILRRIGTMLYKK